MTQQCGLNPEIIHVMQEIEPKEIAVDVKAESFGAHLHLWISSSLRYQLDVSRLLSGGQLRMQLIFIFFFKLYSATFHVYIYIFEQ